MELNLETRSIPFFTLPYVSVSTSVASAVQKLNVGQIFFIAALDGLLAFFHKSPFVKQRIVTFCISFYDRRAFRQTIDTRAILAASFSTFQKKLRRVQFSEPWIAIVSSAAVMQRRSP